MTGLQAWATKAVLVVDDDRLVRRALARDFDACGWTVHQADGYDEAMKVARRHPIDLAVLDLHMPTRSGIDVLESLRKEDLCKKAVVLTGYGSIRAAVESIQRGAVEFITKPSGARAILAAVDEAPVVGSRSRRMPTLAQVEWDHLHRALKAAKGSVSEAARRLRIPRRTLQRKLKKAPPKP